MVKSKYQSQGDLVKISLKLNECCSQGVLIFITPDKIHVALYDILIFMVIGRGNDVLGEDQETCLRCKGGQLTQTSVNVIYLNRM